MTELIRCMRDEDSVMTRTMRAWRKANAYVRSGQHAKAIYWLNRTVEILETGRPRPSRLKNIDGGDLLTVLFLFWALFWMANRWGS
jgi:hypothetical protein